MWLCLILGGVAAVTAISSWGFPPEDPKLESQLRDQLREKDKQTNFEEVLDFNHPSKFNW